MESQSPKIHQAAEASLAVGFVSNSFLVASFACALAVGCSGQVASSHGAGGASQAGAGGSSTGGAGGSAGSSAGSSSTGGRSGGTGGGSSSCKVDADCSPAACGQCPDGSKACPTTRCMIGFGTPSATGYCTSDPAACPQCKVDADCAASSCMVCTDGQVVCNTQHCINGTCGQQGSTVCASRVGPACTSPSQCPASVCGNCPDGSKVCTDAGCTDGLCRSAPTSCPQCKSDGDCGKPACSVCYDGNIACGTATCQKGQCSVDFPKCPERPTGRPLLWYWTCGLPVCRVITGDAGVSDASVSCAQAGTPCTDRGATCGNGASSCGSVLVCEDHDPTQGGCPISSAKFKDDIRYLRENDLELLRDETLKVRLANYRYKSEFTSDPMAQHLGFIIEDDPASPAVDRGHDRVDLYGYVSMVVASLQLQQKEIQSLRHQVQTLQAATRACAKKK